MALFEVAYRLEYDSSYQERYDSLIAIIDEKMHPKWHHTTSLVIGVCPNSTLELAYALFYRTKLSPSKDHVLVINLDVRNFKYYGTKPADIETLALMFSQLD